MPQDIDELLDSHQVIVMQIAVAAASLAWLVADYTGGSKIAALAPLLGVVWVAYRVQTRKNEIESWYGNDDLETEVSNDEGGS